MTALVLVYLAFLLVCLIEHAVNFAVVLTQLLIFFSIFFFFRCFLSSALIICVLEVELLGYCLTLNSLSVLASNYNLALNLAVVGVVCSVSAYLTLLVS